jgi:PRTRC genetic system protein C
MESQILSRIFEFNGVRLPDPAPNLSVEDVRAVYAHQYPDIATAAITGPEAVGDKLRYLFSRPIGAKG